MVSKFRLFFRKLYVIPINIYRKLISPLLPPDTCLYHPSCSQYAKHSIIKHGIIKGTILGFLRLIRCNGLFFTGGDDPVPEKFSFRQIGEDYRRFVRKGRRKRKNDVRDEERKREE